MEPLRLDDPRRFGPYEVIARYDSVDHEFARPARRFLAKTRGGNETAVITAPCSDYAQDSDYAERFLSEAKTVYAYTHGQRWLARVAETSTAEAQPVWFAVPFLPAIPLDDIVNQSEPGLPERTVRGLGAVVAEALAPIHASGTAHAGIFPSSVLVTGDGIRLTAFGAVRAATRDGEPRKSVPGLAEQFLPPEQISGGRPRPLGDIYALGKVLVFAATAQASTVVSKLPQEMRDLVAACLEEDPVDRPDVGTVLDWLLRDTSSRRSSMAEHGGGTAIDSGASRAAELLYPGWLPKRVRALLSIQAAEVLAAEVSGQVARDDEAELDKSPTQIDVQGHSTGLTAEDSCLEASSGASGRVLARRVLMTSLVSGGAGVAAGGTATWLATAEEPPEKSPAERLAAKWKGGDRPTGFPPHPQWHYSIPGSTPKVPPLIWQEQVVLVSGDDTIGIDIASGREVWRQKDCQAHTGMHIVDNDTVLLCGSEAIAINPITGNIRWRLKDFQHMPPDSTIRFIGVDHAIVWLAISKHTVIAFDTANSREVWRRKVADTFNEGYVTNDAVVLAMANGDANDKDRAKTFLALSRETGQHLWTHIYEDIGPDVTVAVSADGSLVVSDGNRLLGFVLGSDSNAKWQLSTTGLNERQREHFGRAVFYAGNCYVTDSSYNVHAVETASGKVKWQRNFAIHQEWAEDDQLPVTRISPNGKLVLSAHTGGVNAVDAFSGKLLWRFTDVAVETSTPLRRKVELINSTALVLTGGNLYALPLAKGKSS